MIFKKVMCGVLSTVLGYVVSMAVITCDQGVLRIAGAIFFMGLLFIIPITVFGISIGVAEIMYSRNIYIALIIYSIVPIVTAFRCGLEGDGTMIGALGLALAVVRVIEGHRKRNIKNPAIAAALSAGIVLLTYICLLPLYRLEILRAVFVHSWTPFFAIFIFFVSLIQRLLRGIHSEND